MKYNINDIKRNLMIKVIGSDIILLNEIGSTNDYAKTYGDKFSNGTVVIADKQTKGKGRNGRKWLSEKDKNIYMSVIIKSDINVEEIYIITFAAALSVCMAVEKIVGINPNIKWPNDVLFNNKKLCGILTETKFINNSIKYAVCGIGLNVNNDYFNEELHKVATSIKIITGKKINRNVLVTGILNNFEELYINYNKDNIMNEYKKRCININRPVKVIYNDNIIYGVGKGIDYKGNFIVKTKDNEIISICSGEASIRGLNGYLGF